MPRVLCPPFRWRLLCVFIPVSGACALIDVEDVVVVSISKDNNVLAAIVVAEHVGKVSFAQFARREPARAHFPLIVFGDGRPFLFLEKNLVLGDGVPMIDNYSGAGFHAGRKTPFVEENPL